MYAKRIALLITGLTYAGAETQFIRLALELRKAGRDVMVISMLPPEAFVSDLTGSGIRVLSLGMRRGAASVRALARSWFALRRWKPDILVTFLYHANLLGRLLRISGATPVVLSSIRSESFGSNLRSLIFRMTRWIDRHITVNSELTASRLVARGVVSRRNLTVIPNGIDVGVFEANGTPPDRIERGDFMCSPDDFVWIAVGRLEEAKDYPNLLVAFRELSKQKPSAKLLIAGQGSLGPLLNQMVQDYGLGDRVKLLGLRKDVKQLLSLSDALVLSSAWEGMPNVVMEAAAAGLPIVATNVGGVPELVRDGWNGILVPPKDSIGLAEAMRYMMELSRDERKEMGRRGRDHVANTYDLQHVSRQWIQLLDRIVNPNMVGDHGR